MPPMDDNNAIIAQQQVEAMGLYAADIEALEDRRLNGDFSQMMADWGRTWNDPTTLANGTVIAGGNRRLAHGDHPECCIEPRSERNLKLQTMGLHVSPCILSQAVS